MAAFIAMETGFSSRDITTLVLGGHGVTMVPLPRFCTIKGIPVSYFIDDERMNEIIDRTRNGGAEILALRKNSSAYVAPAAAIAYMIDAILHNRHRIVPTVALLDGEYGEKDIAMGVPCVLGITGVKKIIELPLDKSENALFRESASTVRSNIETLNAQGS
jgi:malate dehydrogenase